jgi:hypothetical protein
METLMKAMKAITWIVAAFFLTACAPTVRTITVDDLRPRSDYPQLAAVGGSQGTIYLAWNESGAKFASAKMGRSLGSPVTVLPASHSAPQLAAAGSNVYMVSTFSSSSGDKDIYFATSNDYGGSFTSAIEVSENDTFSVYPSLASIANNAYFAWIDYAVGSQQANVLFRASNNAGQSFSSIKMLGTSANVGSRVKVAASGTNVYIVWCDTNGALKFAKSADTGTNFSATQSLGASVLCGGEELLALGDNIYVSWIGLGNNDKQDIFVRASSDGGNTFGAAINVSNTPGRSIRAQLSAALTNVYIVWQDDTPGNEDVFFSRSTNSGLSFQSSQNLSANSLASWRPRIASSGQYVHIVWQQDLGSVASWDAAYVRSGNAGETFGSVLNNPNGHSNPSEDTEPVIVARGIDRYIAWQRGASLLDQQQIMFYSSTSCPTMPSESGIFRCPK